MSIHKYWWGTVTNIKVLVFAWTKAIYENGVFCYEQNLFVEWKYIQTTKKKEGNDDDGEQKNFLFIRLDIEVNFFHPSYLPFFIQNGTAFEQMFSMSQVL